MENAMKKVVVLISGYRGSGKDTAANIAFDKGTSLDLSPKIAHFANSLKDFTAETYNIPIHYFHDQDLKERALFDFPVRASNGHERNIQSMMHKLHRTASGVEPVIDSMMSSDESGNCTYNGEAVFWTPRGLLIAEASLKRAVDPHFWAKTLIRNISASDSRFARLIIIPDFRFTNEVMAVKAAADANTDVITVRVNRFDSPPILDPTETHLDDFKFDHVIENKGKLDELNFKVSELIGEIIWAKLSG
jgi:hypothetical protein